MERQRSCTRRKFYNRLLNFFLPCVLCFASITAYAQDFSQLTFRQENDFAIMEESIFTIEIADINPTDVVVYTKEFPFDVEFISSEKTDGFIGQGDGSIRKGTVITYTLRFLDSGTYDLGSLPVYIQGAPENILFPEVTVFPNPSLLLTEMYIEYDEPFYSLHEGTFTLFAKYFKTIEDITISLSENALIEEMHTNFDIPSSDFMFSDEAIAIASFSCIPFSSGTLTLPEIRATFTTFSGQRQTELLANYSITVLSQEDYSPTLYGEERRFLEGVSQTADSTGVSFDVVHDKKEDVVQKLALLRVTEKYSLFPFSATAQRKAIEQTENIQNEREVSFTWTVIGCIASVLLLCGGFVLYLLQKKEKYPLRKNYSFTCFMVGICILCATVLYGRSLLDQYAVMYGSQLHTIPEYESQIVSSLYAGMRVKILRSVGDWFLVSQSDGRSGWILKEDCILITK